MAQPWEIHTEDGYVAGLDPKWPKHRSWDTDTFPFVVRWTVPYGGHRLTPWTSIHRAFRTLEEAIAAYKLPFKGLSVDCIKFNGGPPGRHLDTLARRKACKPTKWHASVPAELRKGVR